MGIIDSFKQRKSRISELIDLSDKIIEEINIDIGSRRGEFIPIEKVNNLGYKCHQPIEEINDFIRQSILPNRKLTETRKKLEEFMGSLEHIIQVHNSNTAILFRENGRRLI